MKIAAAVSALLLTSASAFTAPSMTFAVGKKAPAKKIAGTKAVGKAAPKKVVAKAAVAKKVVAKAAAKPAPKPVAKPAPKAVAKPAPKAVAKPAPKVVAKPAPKVVAKPAPKVVAKAAPKPKPAPVKAAPKPAPVRAAPKFKSSGGGTVASVAIPYEEAPALLDGSLVGDFGFDPCFLATRADSMADYFNGVLDGKTNLDGLSWYREAELMHGRICMVAVVGMVAPGFGTISGSDWTGVDAFSYKNPLEAFTSVPGLSLFQIFAFMSILEFRRIDIISKAGSNYVPGASQNWGQGGWNPFNLNYTPEEYKIKQLQELKHARLAMIGFLGTVFQANASGESVPEQWSTAFSAPEYYAKSGYFFPEGI